MARAICIFTWDVIGCPSALELSLQMRRAMENPNGKTNVSGVFAWLYVHLAIDAEKYELTDPCCHTMEQKPKFQIWIVPAARPVGQNRGNSDFARTSTCLDHISLRWSSDSLNSLQRHGLLQAIPNSNECGKTTSWSHKKEATYSACVDACLTAKDAQFKSQVLIDGLEASWMLLD
jgi:hypothetical protein